MQIENKHNCTGCGACYNICPMGAIKMRGDKYGFYKPVIDKEKCICCGLCDRTCPIDNYHSNNFSEPEAFAFMNSDEIRFLSSSGGAFSAFADHILQCNGVVYGVVWNDKTNAVHSRAVNKDDIAKMRGSKYVQSDTQYSYKQIKKDLDNGEKVLFSGTPCQIAGLKSYLKKDYTNLLTVDIICHGVQSPLFLEKYKKNFLKYKKNEKILNISFRSKISPWIKGCYSTTIETNKRVYNKKADNYTSFMDLSLNNCCLSCQFTGIPRIADITIGDFWGIDEYDSSLNDKKGTSIIIINSKKGCSFFENIKKHYRVYKVPLNIVTKNNPNIIKPTTEVSRRRDFLEKLKNPKITYSQLTSTPLHIQLYKFLPQNIKDLIKYKILKREKCLKK